MRGTVQISTLPWEVDTVVNTWEKRLVVTE